MVFKVLLKGTLVETECEKALLRGVLSKCKVHMDRKIVQDIGTKVNNKN